MVIQINLKYETQDHGCESNLKFVKKFTYRVMQIYMFLVKMIIFAAVGKFQNMRFSGTHQMGQNDT